MEKVSQRISVEGVDHLALYGHNDSNLFAIEKRYHVSLIARGDEIIVEGRTKQVAEASNFLSRLVAMMKDGAEERDLLSMIARAIEGREGLPPRRTPDKIVLSTLKGTIGPMSEGQRVYVSAMEQYHMVFVIGPAGTGKTYLAVAAAVGALKRKEVSRIVLARPAVEAGESLGFLPGDLQEKVDPYLRPLYDALHDMMEFGKLRRLLEMKVIEVVPLAYMRGRTLNHAFVILDEAQNTTAIQMKMFLTRLGTHAKAVITGDITQVDLPSDTVSGLNQVREILAHVEGVEFVYLTERDVVRNPLVQRVIRAYEVYEASCRSRERDRDDDR